MNMVKHALNWLTASIEHIRDESQYRQLVSRAGALGAQVTVEGQRYINFASNDYLGLANDDRVVAAAQQAIKNSGWGGGSSPLIVGHSDEHAALEAALAEFEETEAALLFPSGFAANTGTIPCLVGDGDTILSDAHNHASIIDGCRLSRAATEIYPHADCNALEKLLQQRARGRRLIITDGLFSMDGDIAPLDELADLADKYDAMLMVDEAHATGVLGEHGRGAAEHFGVADRVDIKVGTMSKALGAMGGFVAGSAELINWIINRARSYIFSTACPAANCAAGLTALEIVRNEPARRHDLLAIASTLRQRLQADGWSTGKSTTQVVPIIIGDSDQAMRLAAQLRQHHLFAPGIRPPSVAEGRALIRISLCYGHTPNMVDRLLHALKG